MFRESNIVKPQPTPRQTVLSMSIAARCYSSHFCTNTLLVSFSSVLFGHWFPKNEAAYDQTHPTCWKSCRCSFTLAEQAVPVDGLAFADRKSVHCKETVNFLENVLKAFWFWSLQFTWSIFTLLLWHVLSTLSFELCDVRNNIFYMLLLQGDKMIAEKLEAIETKYKPMPRGILLDMIWLWYDYDMM